MALFEHIVGDDLLFDDDDVFGQLGDELGEDDDIDIDLDDLEAEIDADLAGGDAFGAELGSVTNATLLDTAVPLVIPEVFRDMWGPDQALDILTDEAADIVATAQQAIAGALADAPTSPMDLRWKGGWPGYFDGQVDFLRTVLRVAAARGNFNRAIGLEANMRAGLSGQSTGDDAWAMELKEVLQDPGTLGGYWIGREGGLAEAVAEGTSGTAEDYNGLAIALLMMERLAMQPIERIIGDWNAQGAIVVSTETPVVPGEIDVVTESETWQEEVIAPPTGYAIPRPQTILAVGYALMAAPPLIKAAFGGR